MSSALTTDVLNARVGSYRRLAPARAVKSFGGRPDGAGFYRIADKSRRFGTICSAAVEEEPVAESDAGAVPNPMLNKKLRIKLRSFEVKSIKAAVEMILSAAKETGASVAGPVPLPTRRKIFCVLTSPHVDKDAREQFEIRTHSRLIDVRQLTVSTIDKLMELDIPAGVEANIKIL